MPSVELATAFVSIVPTTKGITSSLEKELSPLTGAASKAGADSGKALGTSFGTGSKTLGTSLDKSTTLVGGFKEKAGSAFGAVADNAGAMGIAAGGALVAFGIKAVGAFTDTAKAAIDLGGATGLAVEDASRWIAIGDDMGVSASELQSGLGKVSKTLDDTKWADYGIATHDAGGQARDVNDILLDSFDKLGKITNETERARVGNDLFGKGYANLAPLIGKSRTEMEKYLGSVEKGQVITDKEAAKAEKFRLAQDSLSDAMGEVTLAVGGLVAELSPLIEKGAAAVTKFTEIAEKAQDAADKVGGLTNVMQFFPGNPFPVIKASIDAATDSLDVSKVSLEKLNEIMAESGSSAEHQAAVTQQWYDAHELLNPAIAETERETRKLPPVIDKAALAATNFQVTVDGVMGQVQRDIDDAKGKWETFHDTIDQDRAMLTYKQHVDELKQAMIDAGTAATEHGPGSPEHVAAVENVRLKQLDLESETADLAQKYTDMPVEKVTTLKAQIDAGSIDTLPAQIQGAIEGKEYRVVAHLDRITVDGETHAAGSFGPVTVRVSRDGSIKQSAKGGYTDDRLNLINEEGGELVRLPNHSWVATHDASKDLFADMMKSAFAPAGASQVINVNNYRRDIGVADLNQVFAMARLAS